MTLRRVRRSGWVAAALAVCLTAACSSHPALASSAKPACNRYASPHGSDRHRGSLRRPFRTLRKLDESLRAGQTGCLLGGRYGGIYTKFLLDHGGSRRAAVTLRPAPGASVTLRGWVLLAGSHIVLSHLNIDGSNTFYRRVRPGISCHLPASQGLSISGHNDVLEYDNIYQSVASLRSVGIGVGWTGDAYGTVIRFNRIHDVGQCLAYDSLIYLAHGNNVQIYDNWMWNDRHGRGVQLYPGPTNARIWGNVIDRAGSGFVIADTSGSVASGNRIFDNVVMNSTGLPSEHQRGYALTSYWGAQPGAGNVFYDNISFGNGGGIARTTHVKLWGNRRTRPVFADSESHDYRLVVPLTALLRR